MISLKKGKKRGSVRNWSSHEVLMMMVEKKTRMKMREKIKHRFAKLLTGREDISL
jgi:hypothetical protein